ncbi:MAG: MFS transporter [Phycisphaeraceae bacterium]
MSQPAADKPKHATFAALANRGFAALWAGTFLSNVGSWMHNTASRVFVYDTTGNALLLGLDAFASGAPMILMLWGGVLADRFDRRKILIIGNLFAAMNVAALSVLAFFDVLHIWHVLTVSLLNGLINALISPASQALLPDLVERSKMSNAIALNSVQFNVARVAGPAIAGVVYFWLGAGWCFAVNALSFLALTVVLLSVRTKPAPPPKQERLLLSLAKGLAFLDKRRDIKMIIAMAFFTALFAAPALSMLPALVKEEFHLPASYFTYLVSAFGIGAVVGGLLLAARERDPQPWKAGLSLTALAVAEVGLCFAGSFEMAMVLMVIVGMMQVGTMVRLGSATHHAVPGHLRGRLMSFQTLAFRLGMPMGSLIAGGITAAMGEHLVSRIYLIYGSLLLIAISAIMFLRRRWDVQYVAMSQEEAELPEDE